ncbi:MAG: type II secretion system protein GspD, partial [bacterium]
AKKTTPTPTPRPPVPRTGTTPESQPASSTVVGGTAGELEGDITITAYEDINAIIIKSSPGAYLALVETIKKLDIAPKQVLIEVFIAEVTLTDEERLGIEWLLKASGNPTVIVGSGVSTDGTIGISSDLKPTVGGIPGNYFGYVINPDKFIGAINVFAGLSKLNVLSSPHILALDNKEAKIEIGNEIPIATGLNTSTTGTTQGATLVSSGQIQYKTAGVLLTVTPHISDKDNVTLKVNQEFSALGPSVNVGGSDFPGFSTRRAQTTGIVKDGHTLVIGGMIREDTSLTKAGLPFLSKIPILGSLFGSTSHTLKRTELIVLVTPHVVRDQEEADKATKEFQEKVRSIKESIEQIERGNKERELKKADEQGKG